MKWISRVTLLILVITVAATRLLAIYQTDATSVYTTPLVDDSYYYFALGHNLAEGNGIKIDGVHDTTGFQPLWGFLLAVPYRMFPDSQTIPITVIQMMELILSMATTGLMFGLARRFVPVAAAAVVTGLIMLSPYSITTSVNGMETALAIMMIVAVFLCLHEVYRNPRRSVVIIIGFLCGVSFLARVDTAFLTIAILLVLVMKPPQLGQRWVTPIIVGCCAVIPVLPWVVIALAMGKSPMPESGEAVRIIAILLRGSHATPLDPSISSFFDANFAGVFIQKFISFLAEFAYRIDFSSLQILSPFPLTTNISTFLFVFIMMLIFLLPILLASHQAEFTPLVYVWGLYVAPLFVLYPAVVQSDWFFNRYVAPISAMFTFLSAIYLFREFGSGWKLVARIGLVILVFVAYGAILINDGAYRWILYGEQARSSESHFDAVQWINANIPSDALVAGFQTGLVGYYSLPTVINLDGKVNADARHALIDAEMGNYLCDSGIKYIVDQPMIIQHLLIERTANWNDGALKLLYTAKGEPDNPMQIYQFDCTALKSMSS